MSQPQMKNSTTIAGAGKKPPAREEEMEESSNSSYFPGCRKDANCHCRICIESMNATLDLMPLSVQKSSLTRLSSNATELTPLSFGSLSTPTSKSIRTTPPRSPPEIIAPISPRIVRSSRKPGGESKTFVLLVLILSILLAAAEFGGFFFVVSKPVFSRSLVRRYGERALGVKGLDGKLRFLESRLVEFDGKVSNCSLANSRWEISHQDGLLLNSHCKLYKSLSEEIRIWGWPLQTAGLLVTGFSSRSFTVISGRVTEWSDGKIGYVTRKANSSWTHPKWGSSAVQLDRDTWILEYRRSSILENPRLVSVSMGFLKRKVSRILKRMTRNVRLFFYLEKRTLCYSFGSRSHVQVPT